MPDYTVEMHHTESSFTALSKMQYNLFCQTNRVGRALISFGLLVFAAGHLNDWWAYFIIFYAIYLTSSTKMTATRAARKLTAQIEKSGMDWPASRLEFCNGSLHITALPEKEGDEEAVLRYSEVHRLAEDHEYFFIFRDKFGGYLVPKETLGEKQDEFRTYLEKKTGETCYSGTSPLMKFLSGLRRDGQIGKKR